MSSLLDKATRKLFIKQLSFLKNSENSSSVCKWLLKRGSLGSAIGFVWLQGLITEFRQDENLFLLDDGTGVALIYISSNTVGMSETSYKNGKYVMVMSEIIEVGVVPRLKSNKVVDLSSDVNAETIWNLEVIDMWNYIVSFESL